MKYKTFAFDAKNNISAILIQEGEFNQVTYGLTIYVKNANDNVLSGIFIDDQRNKNRTRTILAERGIVSTYGNNVTIALVNGSVQENNKGKFTFGSFDKYTADLGVIAKLGHWICCVRKSWAMLMRRIIRNTLWNCIKGFWNLFITLYLPLLLCLRYSRLR